MEDVSVNLNYAGLTVVNFEEAEFSRARHIYLKRNLLKSLSPSIGRLQHLVELHVVANSLECLPEEIGNSHNLVVLDISGNHLSSLPARFTDLQSLQKLKISANNFQQFPEEICHLKNLVVLEASRNNFGTIPPRLGNCSNLTLLALDKNGLRSIPRQLYRLKKLKELSLCGNKLVYIPYDVGKLTQLGLLNLDNNPLLSVPVSVKQINQCKVGVYSCLALHTGTREEIEEWNIWSILPSEIGQVCLAGQSAVPCLEELSARTIADNCIGYRPDLSLPKAWLEILCDSVGTCECCRVEMFVSVFPMVLECATDNVVYIGLFCSLRCVNLYKNDTPMKIVYPV